MNGKLYDMEFEYIPWNGSKSNDIFCYHLNRKVPRYKAWPCCPSENCNDHDCVLCSMSAEYLYAEHQKWVDDKQAIWITTENGERLAVQPNEYAIKNSKYKDLIKL